MQWSDVQTVLEMVTELEDSAKAYGRDLNQIRSGSLSPDAIVTAEKKLQQARKNLYEAIALILSGR